MKPFELYTRTEFNVESGMWIIVGFWIAPEYKRRVQHTPPNADLDVHPPIKAEGATLEGAATEFAYLARAAYEAMR